MLSIITGILIIFVILVSIFTMQWGKGLLWFISGGIAVSILGESIGLFLISLIFSVLLIKGLTKCEFCDERIGVLGKKYKKGGRVFCKDCSEMLELSEDE
ncbi:MAG: hypothetical protein FH753_06825 [Firmicutes bacterium]|nr:hypothetical protein [Bacillota bacterium]